MGKQQPRQLELDLFPAGKGAGFLWGIEPIHRTSDGLGRLEKLPLGELVKAWNLFAILQNTFVKKISVHFLGQISQIHIVFYDFPGIVHIILHQRWVIYQLEQGRFAVSLLADDYGFVAGI